MIQSQAAALLLSPCLVALTTVLLFRIQEFLAALEGDTFIRPFGIGFLIPVVILTLLGGRAVGALTLMLSAGASVFFLAKPDFSWSIQYARDWLELAMLLIVGSIVIFAVEALRQNASLVKELAAAASQKQVFLRDMLVSVTDGKLHLCDSRTLLPECLVPVGEPITLTPETLAPMRRSAEAAAQAVILSSERTNDLITAVSECAMNAVVHAGGGTGQICARKDGTVQVWIVDHGRGIAIEHLPRATLEKGYTTAGTLGHGFKMMLQSVDRLWLLTGPAGTTVVLEQDRKPAQPSWLAG